MSSNGLPMSLNAQIGSAVGMEAGLGETDVINSSDSLWANMDLP